MTRKRADIIEAAKSFGLGEQMHLQDILGVHSSYQNGKYEYIFRVYAPEAEKVELTGDFNSWGSEKMIPIYSTSIWESLIESDISLEGMSYKYRVYSEKGVYQISDMCESYGQCDGRDESIIYTKDEYQWLTNRSCKCTEHSAMNMLECQMGYYKNALGSLMNYRDIAEIICGEAVEMGYTHVFLRLNAQGKRTAFGTRPYFFSPPARHGRPEDFMYLIDRLHSYGVNVLVEINTPACVEIPEISSYEESLLQSCVVSMCERFRADGIVLVAEKKIGEENIILTSEDSAVNKLKVIIERIKSLCPDIMLIAGGEISALASEDKGTFDLYINSRASETISNAIFSAVDTRKYKYSRLNYELMNCFERRCIIPFPEYKSEDKYDGQTDDIKLAYSYVMLHPGKKLMRRDAKNNERSELRGFFRNLNCIYKKESALWENDFSWKGFEWIRNASKESGISAFVRRSNNAELLCVVNFENNEYMDVKIPIKNDCTCYDCIFDSLADEKKRSYTENENGERVLNLSLPPKCVRIYKPALLFEYEGRIEKL